MRDLPPSVRVPEPRGWGSPRHSRASAFSRVLGWTFLLLILAGALAFAAALYATARYTAPGPLAAEKTITIDQGLSVLQIGAALEQGGIIDDGRLFAAMAYVMGTRSGLKAGDYAFPPQATMEQVMGIIAEGRSLSFKLSIPEGFTSEMAAARLNASDLLSGPPVIAPAEGTILPDTYVFSRGTPRQKLLTDMQAAQARLLSELWAQRDPDPVIETPEQAVTLASIVEKETSVPAERPRIAAVFLNRLRKGMRLQSDPTIIYGIAGGKGRLDRPLTRTDIETPTPYNTYAIRGLPPGPIANPGRAALQAVLRPEPTDELYFVADGTGGHAFATTLAEHNRNVRQWRQIAGNAAAAAAADAEEAGQDAGQLGGQETGQGIGGDGSGLQQIPAPDAPALGEVPAPPPPPAASAADDQGPLAAAIPSADAPQPAAAPAAPPRKPGEVVVVEGRKTAIPRPRPPR